MLSFHDPLLQKEIHVCIVSGESGDACLKFATRAPLISSFSAIQSVRDQPQNIPRNSMLMRVLRCR